MKFYVKKTAALLCAAAGIAVFSISATAEQTIELPPVKKFALNNGIRGFYIEDELPQLTITVSAAYGTMSETAAEAGLSDLMVKALSMSGSEKFPGTSAYERLESLGGRLAVETSWESTTISVQILSRFKDEAFEVITDLITAPAFNEKTFDSARGQRAEEIRRRDDDPFNKAFDRLRSAVFSGTGYGSVPSIEVLNTFILDDVKKTWKKQFSGSNLLLGVSSSISYKEIKDLSAATLGNVERGVPSEIKIDYSKVSETVKNSDGKIFLYVADIPQATVIVGTIAPGITSPDLYPLSLMNYVLGGGSFNSRLMTEIRVKRGLAYSTQSIFRPRGETGVFMAFAQTRNESAAEVLSLILGSIDEMASTGVSDEELAWAKESIFNSYVFRFDTRMNLLSNYLNLERYGLPEDYYETYLEKIKAVSGKNLINRSAGLFAEGTIKVVVGSRDSAESLKKFGEVVIIEGDGR